MLLFTESTMLAGWRAGILTSISLAWEVYFLPFTQTGQQHNDYAAAVKYRSYLAQRKTAAQWAAERKHDYAIVKLGGHQQFGRRMGKFITPSAAAIHLGFLSRARHFLREVAGYTSLFGRSGSGGGRQCGGIKSATTIKDSVVCCALRWCDGIESFTTYLQFKQALLSVVGCQF